MDKWTRIPSPTGQRSERRSRDQWIRPNQIERRRPGIHLADVFALKISTMVPSNLRDWVEHPMESRRRVCEHPLSGDMRLLNGHPLSGLLGAATGHHYQSPDCSAFVVRTCTRGYSTAVRQPVGSQSCPCPAFCLSLSGFISRVALSKKQDDGRIYDAMSPRFLSGRR
jgi:hypothetical protein